MSERGSFVTEYIYCNKCFKAVKDVLLSKEKFLCSQTIESWEESKNELPIVAGNIGELYSGGELVRFELELIPRIADKICHPVRIAVLADTGQNIFVVRPRNMEPRKE